MLYPKQKTELQKAGATKDAEIQDLRSKLDARRSCQETLQSLEATKALERERDALESTKNNEIQSLKAKLDAADIAKKPAINEAVSLVEKQRDELKTWSRWRH